MGPPKPNLSQQKGSAECSLEKKEATKLEKIKHKQSRAQSGGGNPRPITGKGVAATDQSQSDQGVSATCVSADWPVTGCVSVGGRGGEVSGVTVNPLNPVNPARALARPRGASLAREHRILSLKK